MCGHHINVSSWQHRIQYVKVWIGNDWGVSGYKFLLFGRKGGGAVGRRSEGRNLRLGHMGHSCNCLPKVQLIHFIFVSHHFPFAITCQLNCSYNYNLFAVLILIFITVESFTAFIFNQLASVYNYWHTTLDLTNFQTLATAMPTLYG